MRSWNRSWVDVLCWIANGVDVYLHLLRCDAMRSGRCNVMSICDILVSRGMLRGWLANDNSPTQDINIILSDPTVRISISRLNSAGFFLDRTLRCDHHSSFFTGLFPPRILQKVVAEKGIDIYGLTTSHNTYFCIYISSSYERNALSQI